MKPPALAVAEGPARLSYPAAVNAAPDNLRSVATVRFNLAIRNKVSTILTVRTDDIHNLRGAGHHPLASGVALLQKSDAPEEGRENPWIDHELPSSIPDVLYAAGSISVGG